MSNKSFASFMRAMPAMRTGTANARALRAAERSTHFDEATRLMEDGRWQQAFTRLAASADAGQPQAARIALLFVRRGAWLFGGSYHASAQQRECWQRCSD